MNVKQKLSTLMLTMISGSVFAFTPTPAQIQQFQSLPRAQQEQLARQMGVDINSISASSSSVNQNKPVQAVNAAERSTPVDEANRNQPAKEMGKSDKLKAFGYDMFAGQPMPQVQPSSVPVPLDYQVAAGDEINVQLFGKTNRQMSLEIKRDGSLHFPEFGPVSVAGQTFAQVRQQITTMIKQKVMGVDVAVSMGAMRTMQVFIAGDAKQPGAYNVNGLTSITQALIASGGVNETGSLRNIQLKRKGRVVKTLDLYDFLLKGDTRADVRLLAGDTLFIPQKKNTIELTGEVQRPAIYELKNHRTLGNILSMGTTKPNAYLSQVSIRRMTKSGVKQFTVDATTQQGQHFLIKNGDSIQVSASSSMLESAIAVRGEVVRQGAMGYHAGMRVSDAIKSVKQDLKPNSDLHYALIVRQINDNHDIEVLQFDLGNALHHPQSKDNLALKVSDQIFVFDNGVDTDYWYKQKADHQKKSDDNKDNSGNLLADNRTDNKTDNRTDNRTGNSAAPLKPHVGIDHMTGAEVDLNKQSILQDKDTKAVSDTIKQTSREKLITPIIDRLKAQATYAKPARLIDVTGEVRYPGTYPLAINASMQKVINAAGGLTEGAYLDLAEITHRNLHQQEFSVSHVQFSLTNVLSGIDSLPLAAQDHIVINTKPDWQTNMTIDLQGEVKFPGKYTFQRGERLEDIIERAGGFTRFADPKAAIFSRVRLQRQEQERLALLNMELKQEIASLTLRRQTSSASYPTSPNDAMAVADKLSETKALGRLVIDMSKAMTGDENANVMLEKGDKLYIPAKNPTISIMGEVQFASNHTYQPNLTIEDYIASAGGTKKQADTDRIYVVHADGSVSLPNNSFWFSRKNTQLEPGDTIIVPIDTDYLDGLITLTSATQILYQIGVAYKAIKD